FEQVRHETARMRPAIAVASMVALPEQKAAAHALRRAGVPVVVNRHGELGSRHVPIVAYQDVEAVDYALCWGSWEQEWVKRHAPRPVQTRLVGSPQVELAVASAPGRAAARSSLGLSADARVALYVPTGLS